MFEFSLKKHMGPYLPSTYFIFCSKDSGALSGNKTSFLVTSVEAFTSTTIVDMLGDTLDHVDRGCVYQR